MTWEGATFARLALLGLVGLIVQLAAVSQVTLLGAAPDLTPLLVAFVGMLGGAIAGAVFGFAVGLALDTALLQALGVSSLVYLSVGYLAGRLRETREPAHALAPVAVGGAAAAVAAIGFSTIQFLLGVDAPVSLALLRQILATVVADTLLALPVFLVVRRALLPALADDPRRRARRATTTRLSPLSPP